MDDTLISWGDPVFQAWTLAWDWRALTHDPLGIFNANVFYPWRNTLAYSDHLFGQALLVLPALALTDNGILADNLSVLLAFVLSALAMYLLAFDLTGNRAAAAVAGLAYAFAPSRMAHLEHLHLLSMQWPPLILLALRRVMELPPAPHLGAGAETAGRGRSWFWPRLLLSASASGRNGWLWVLGASFFAQGLFGIYFFYFTIVMLIIAGGMYALFGIWDRDRSALRRLMLAVVACGVAGALLIPTLWPYQQARNDLSVERTAEEVTFWSATPTDYLAAPTRDRLWNGPTARFNRDLEQNLFPGLGLTLLAAVGLGNRRGGRTRWVLLAVASGSVVLSFGLRAEALGVTWPLPYRLFYDYMPGFRAIRVPARLGLLALVGLGGLAGLGGDLLWRRGHAWLAALRRPAASAWLARAPLLPGALALAVALGGVGLEAWPRMELPDPLPPPNRTPPPAYAWIRDNPAPTLELPMGEGPVASAWPNFWSMTHWNQVVNGYSGIVPPTYYPFRERIAEFPEGNTVRLLQGIGVENIILHSDFPDPGRSAVEAAIARRPELSLALAGPDAVYRLARDPWMFRLAGSVPGGATVDLPAARLDPVAWGLLVAVLQRDGLTVVGDGQIDYLTLPPASSPRCFAILPGGDDPAAWGYAGATAVRAEPEMTLWRAAGC